MGTADADAREPASAAPFPRSPRFTVRRHGRGDFLTNFPTSRIQDEGIGRASIATSEGIVWSFDTSFVLYNYTNA